MALAAEATETETDLPEAESESSTLSRQHPDPQRIAARTAPRKYGYR
jgi:hypothetical protein